MRTFKLVALMAVVGLAAACGSSTTTGPSIPLSSDEAIVSDTAASNAVRPGPGFNGNCRNVVAVVLERVPHPHDGTAELVASYKSAGWERCLVPPTWKSSRPGLIVYDRNRFRAEINWPDKERTTVWAYAPNGVMGRITF
jgi:hypothetical protein